MNYLDVIIGIILLIFIFGGLKNGVIREAFDLAAFIVGIYGAFRFSGFVGEELSTKIDMSEEWISIISFIIVFVALSLIINLIGKSISKIVESLNLGIVDKTGGVLFGIAKGLLLVGVLILVLEFFGLKDIIDEETRSKSIFYSTAEKAASLITDYKDIVIEKLDEGVEIIDDAINSKKI